MALGRRYYLTCESRAVVFHRDLSWLWPTLQVECALVSPTSDTAQLARRNARRLGWTRQSVRFALNADTMTTGRFDLCHRCTATIAKMFGDLPS